MFGGIQADQSISFQALSPKSMLSPNIVRSDPAVAAVDAFSGGESRRCERIDVRHAQTAVERKVSADTVINRACARN